MSTAIEHPADDQTAAVATIQPRWFGIAEATAYTRLSDSSIRRLLATGKLTAHRPVRGKILLDRFELDSYIAGSTLQPRKGRGLNRSKSQ